MPWWGQWQGSNCCHDIPELGFLCPHAAQHHVALVCSMQGSCSVNSIGREADCCMLWCWCVSCVAAGTPSSPVLSSASCCLPPARLGNQVSILRAGVHATCTRLRHMSAATLLDRLAAYGTQTRHGMQHVKPAAVHMHHMVACVRAWLAANKYGCAGCFAVTGRAPAIHLSLPPPAVLRPRQLWTGKQLISAVVEHFADGRPPLTFSSGSKVRFGVPGHSRGSSGGGGGRAVPIS